MVERGDSRSEKISSGSPLAPAGRGIAMISASGAGACAGAGAAGRGIGRGMAGGGVWGAGGGTGRSARVSAGSNGRLEGAIW